MYFPNIFCCFIVLVNYRVLYNYKACFLEREREREIERDRERERERDSRLL